VPGGLLRLFLGQHMDVQALIAENVCNGNQQESGVVQHSLSLLGGHVEDEPTGLDPFHLDVHFVVVFGERQVVADAGGPNGH
jgi:hypothetical protein